MVLAYNLQREELLPSERAFAYKMKLEAMKHQGERKDLTSVQPGQKLVRKSSRDLIAENSPDSSTQIQRYIRLIELEPQLLQMVDEGKIGMTPAVELSYLKPDEQQLLIETIDSEQATPSFSQAQRMKRLSQEGKLNDDNAIHKQPLNDLFAVELKKYALCVELSSVYIFASALFFFQRMQLHAFLVLRLNAGITIRARYERYPVADTRTLNAEALCNLGILLWVSIGIQQTRNNWSSTV